MTQERFFKILDNPELLSGISYEELKTLALAYPYAHNLRYLLALKARQTDHPEAERTLATAAAYSLDRRRLFQLLAPLHLVPQPVSLPEEILELKPLEVVQRELEALSPVLREDPPEPTVVTLVIPPPVAPVAPVIPEPPVPVAEPLEAVEAIQPPQAVIESIPKPVAAPLSFDHWLHQFQPAALVAVPPTVRKEPTKPVIKEPAVPSIAHVLAERSVSENKDVISETLARLYAKQGHREKAITMYERLCLAIPEKSASFAAEIAKLKN